MLDLNKMELPTEAGPTAGTGGGDVPACIKDYASGENVIARVDPVFTEHRFNAVPVRIIIDKDRQGKTHSLSQRISGSGKEPSPTPSEMEIQAVPAGPAAGRSGNRDYVWTRAPFNDAFAGESSD